MSSKHISLAGTATVGPKGQVVIPAEVRDKMGIKPGDKLIALYVEDRQAISFVSEASAQSMVDKMAGHVSALRKSLTKNN